LLLDQIRARFTKGGQPLRYVLAGGLNTLLGLALFPALLWISPYLERNYLIALVISQVVCVVFAFSTYKYGVFRTRTNILREFSYFSSFYYVSFGINLVSLPLLVHGLSIRPLYAQLGFSFVTMIGSYLWHSRVTFRAKRKD
jgi:putative flippase GtrA